MYEQMYASAVVRPEKAAEVKLVVNRILKGKAEYLAAEKATGVPWWFIGITHFMEAGLFWPNHFKRHLHCGDPLTGRTTHVPKGRPKADPIAGKGKPYTWQESAIDALTYMGYTKIKDWSIDNALQLFEKYNGLGYRSLGVPSPYLWSYTHHYVKGKFVLDGKFDKNAVSKQPGVAALMKGLGV